MAERAFISIFKSSRREEMYLYLPRGGAYSDVPEPLRQQFGKPIHVMDLLLMPERKLARTEAPKVLDAVRDKGYYLQMPPPPEELGVGATPYIRPPETGTAR